MRQDTASQTRFRAILASVGDGVIATDVALRIEFMNPAAERLTGWTEAEALCQPLGAVFRIINEHSRATVENPAVRVLSEGVVVGLANHSLLIAKDGRERPVADSGAPIRDEQGVITGVVLVFRDQTAQRAAEHALDASEKKYRTLVDSLSSGLVVHGPDTAVLFSNPRAGALLGLTDEQMRGKTAPDPHWCFLRDDGSPMPLAEYPVNKVLATDVSLQNHVVGVRRPDRAEPTWVLCNAYPMRDESGRLEQVVVSFQDITEHKRAEEALRESEKRYRAYFNLPQIGFAITSLEKGWIEVNQALCDLLGYTHEELRQLTWSELTHPQDLEADAALFDSVMRRERDSYSLEKRFVRKDGQTVWTLLSVHCVRTASGEVEYFIAHLNDITERKRTDEVLAFLAHCGAAPGEDFFRSLARYLAAHLDMSYVCIDRLEGDGLTARTVAVFSDGHFEDNVVYALKDTPCGEVVGKQVCCFPACVCQFFPKDTVLQDLRAESYVGVTLFGHTGMPIGLIAVIGRQPLADRTLAESMLRLVAVRAAGELERRSAELALRASEAQFRTLATLAPNGIYLTSPEGHCEFVNPRWCEMAGLSPEEALGTGWTRGLHPEDREAVFTNWQKMSASEGRWGQEYRFRTGDGKVTWVHGLATPQRDASGKIIHYIGVNIDITERKQAEAEREKLQAQLVQAQKMEAIGHLAGGIAHDFNNLLQVVLGNLDQVLEDLPPASHLDPPLTEVQKAAERAAELTRQLLAFGRRQLMQPVDLDLSELVSGMLGMLQRVLGEHLQLCFVPGGRLGTIHADKGQLEQVLMNLCVNAHDAMPDGGTLTLETKAVVLDDAYCESHCVVTPGRYVLLSVTDTGCGMDAATQAQIFEPFFTTKDVGKGTGLGLAMVYGIVKQHRGAIEVYSEPGHGTCFKIYLPVAESAAADATPLTKPLAVGGTETILLAEDEEAVRSVLTVVLTRAGYTVLVANDGEEALRVFEQHADAIDLALLDVTMPRLGGRELMDRIQARCPRMRFLFSSGYSEGAVHTNFILQKGLRLINKPHRRNELLRLVREVLDAPAP